MKKNYLLVIILLSFFPFNSSAITNSFKANSKADSPNSQTNKSSVALLIPSSSPTVSSTSICDGGTLTLTANLSAPLPPLYTLEWTGPNSYFSTDVNPIISGGALVPASSGSYTLTIYDGIHTAIDVKSTQSVTVNAKVTPLFVGLKTGNCENGSVPTLPTKSKNGITGTWSPAVVSNTIIGLSNYKFTPNPGQCAEDYDFPFTVTANEPSTFSSLPTKICQGDPAPILPNQNDDGLDGTWSPAIVDNTTIATKSYQFTPDPGMCAKIKTINIEVIERVPSTFTLPSIICEKDSAPALPTTSIEGVTGTWFPTSIITTPPGVYDYQFTPDNPNAKECPDTPPPFRITIKPKVTLTFDPIAPICFGDTAPVLPATSKEGIPGTWSPATVSNTTSGDYTFTAANGECPDNVPPPIHVTVKAIQATFTPIAPICSGDTAPVLPTTSLEGVTGTWDKPVSNTLSDTYNFTPDAGQCTSNVVPLPVKVNPIIATFAPIAPICSGDTAPVLPTTSLEGVTGTWDKPVSNTLSDTYNFTPDAGQCTSNVVPLPVKVNPIIATFAPIAPICSGDTAPVLPTTSLEGVTGTWDKPVSNTLSDTYNFTPDAGQCTSNVVPLPVKVNPIIATFAPIAPICSGDTAPVLPTTSLEGVTGTWDKPVSNTLSDTYNFTPDAGQCTSNVVPLPVKVNPTIATFTPIAPICSGDTAPVLPTTSLEGVTGTWDKPVSNTLSDTYNFTPDAGQCTSNVVPLPVKVNPIIATFAPIAPICSGDTAPVLPTTSLEGVTGTWDKPVSNTLSDTYNFTPDAGQCTSNVVPLPVKVNPIIATFAPIAPICSGDTAPVLPTTSLEGVTGTWDKPVSNTLSDTYNFTPDAGQCTSNVVPLPVKVNPIIATFAPIAPICSGDTAPVLPTTSLEGVTGTWDKPVSNTLSDTYNFTPDAGQCTSNVVPLPVKVNPIIATFAPIAPICSGDIAPVLPTTSLEGVTGTWDKPVSNTLSDTYNFTPDAGQCTSNVVPLPVKVNPIIATFAPIAPICSGDTAPVLPTTSLEGVTGTWDKPVSNTLSDTYNFTPDAGQCTSNVVPLPVKVNPIIATFAPITPICSGDTAPVLPTTSLEGVTGTWDKSVSNTLSDTYNFTPDTGQCTSNVVPLPVKVNPIITPTFSSIPTTVCYNSSVVATLPTISNEGITGSWDKTISNIKSDDYIFTPNPGFCATTTSIHINVNVITPGFNTIVPISICQGAIATLPLASTNLISGHWKTTVNISSIDTSTPGTFAYTFVPDSEQCAKETTLQITINPTTATFGTIGSICDGDPSGLPLISQNNVSGSWALLVDNITNRTYRFTPDPGQCTPVTATLDKTITVNPKIIPTFTNIDSAKICSGETSPVLPQISENGISGKWNPATVDNTTAGTKLYHFTPTSGLCATSTDITVTVLPSPTDIAFTKSDVINDKAEGTITITGVTSGVTPFEYSINKGLFTTNSTFSNLLPGDYTITVKDANGCEFSTVASVTSICMFPNGISPNGDDINDTLNLDGCNVSKLILYNRYGREVNKFDNYTDQWAGTNEKGEALPDGTYFYVAEIKDGTSKSGWIYVSR